PPPPPTLFPYTTLFRSQHLMEIVTIDQPFEAQAGHIEPRPQSIAPVPVDPRAVNIKSEGRSEKTKKRPIEPVIDNVAAVHWTFKACEIWQDRFVGYGRIIKRKCTGKESVARNPVRMCGMNASEHCRHDQQTPWQHGITPQVNLATLFDPLKKTAFKVIPMRYCVALCLFGIGRARAVTGQVAAAPPSSVMNAPLHSITSSARLRSIGGMSNTFLGDSVFGDHTDVEFEA